MVASIWVVAGIVVGAFVALLIVLFLGGLVAMARRRAAMRAQLRAEVEAADHALAAARASDRGWERPTIEAAARTAFDRRHPGRVLADLALVQVVDQPGTDADQAVFRAFIEGGGEETITLGRRDGAWVAVP
ncbi:hypothetical protein FSW04_22490 [Baekduia soli]|uniref:Uncharacterized protein n=1 Tax=Baekduia soli TaxID=496014 RepID=A0A5B8UAQ6_9ACTN|nr:hypothetical protein FSW04_22490 [Baekduia soli]